MSWGAAQGGQGKCRQRHRQDLRYMTLLGPLGEMLYLWAKDRSIQTKKKKIRVSSMGAVTEVSKEKAWGGKGGC